MSFNKRSSRTNRRFAVWTQPEPGPGGDEGSEGAIPSGHLRLWKGRAVSEGPDPPGTAMGRGRGGEVPPLRGRETGLRPRGGEAPGRIVEALREQARRDLVSLVEVRFRSLHKAEERFKALEATVELARENERVRAKAFRVGDGDLPRGDGRPGHVGQGPFGAVGRGV
jgi:hypothetical protein